MPFKKPKSTIIFCRLKMEQNSFKTTMLTKKQIVLDLKISKIDEL